jgi:hypothetical protein
VTGRAAAPGVAAARITVAAALVSAAMLAQDVPIQDNSFLIEEAYNQEARVVQHVSTFEHPENGSDWAFGFTQEWPAPDQRHQLSYTVPVERLGGESGLGDVAINYRYQWRGVGGGPLAVAPRLSLLLPTGDEEDGLGSGRLGLEVNLPVSVELAERWVGHWNVGGGLTPDVRAGDGSETDLRSIRLGQGLVFLARRDLNLLLEAVWTSEEVATGGGASDEEESLFVSPGVRFAIDRPSGLQIVPGLAFPIGLGPSDGDRSVFLYLSFEHPF